jgi:hypothetical protein
MGGGTHGLHLLKKRDPANDRVMRKNCRPERKEKWKNIPIASNPKIKDQRSDVRGQC